MKMIDPSACVDHFSAVSHARASIGLLAKTLATYDYVFSHEFHPGHVRGGGSAELRELLPKTVMFPPITFAAFHPDLVFIHDTSRLNGFVFGPIGPYHSALGLFGYRKGLSLEETNALFNENVFQAIGYFDVWNDGARELLEHANHYGLDLSSDFINWARRGVFMYSNVHPMSFVLHDVARRLQEKAGLKARPVNFNYYDIHDLARAEIYPVYPPIAKIFGVAGGYQFKLQNHHISWTVGDFLTLPQYLSSCFNIYRKYETSALSNTRVDAWLADETTSSALVKLAKENLRKGLTPVL